MGQINWKTNIIKWKNMKNKATVSLLKNFPDIDLEGLR